MSDLNNANPKPPKEVKVRLAQKDEEKKKHEPQDRTNDSAIDPQRPKEDILKGFHGG